MTTNENIIPVDGFDAEAALLRLRRKEGNWVEWGQSCQRLQKDGYTAQQIFEASGFEPIHQNQIMVAAQVFNSMMEVGIKPTTETHFSRVGSDSLYELRVLGKKDRAAVADFLYERNINSDGSKEVAKAVKEFTDLRQRPDGFSDHPGDAVAYQYWRYAKQQNDLMEKTRLVARGLLFAHSPEARQQVEKLLGAISIPQVARPTLPLYRLESDEDLPRFVPVAGKLPIASPALTDIPPVRVVNSFGVINTTNSANWVGLPGWQIVSAVVNPVVIFTMNQQLLPDAETNEELLLLIDRAAIDWDEYKYFAVDRDGQVVVEWFSSAPSETILGQVVLVLRPKRLLVTGDQHDLWQIEE
jgi:Rubisco Assembly chaperone C-terminal domain/Rubisco accumulation factor 1 alpha helical domain/Rubisco accumulation factor 1 helix turn helix domain